MFDVMHARSDVRLVQSKFRRADTRKLANRHRICSPVANKRCAGDVTQREQPLAPQVRVWIARHRKCVNVTRVEASDAQARSNRIAREPGVMLDATKALLFHGRHQRTIAQQRCGDVAVVRVNAEDDHQSDPARAPRIRAVVKQRRQTAC
jgi:hypothetical protein